MNESSPGRRTGAVLSTSLLVLLAVASGVALATLGAEGPAAAIGEAMRLLRAGDLGGALSRAAAGGALPCLLLPTLGPLLIALVLAIAGRGRASASAPAPGDRTSAPASAAEQSADSGRRRATPPAHPRPAPPAPAFGLRLLAALQEEARLLDFVREDIASYSDEQVGSAVRGIHAALRKAIDERLTLEAILPGDDGDPVEVPAGFDPALIRMTGQVRGEPPYRGVLRHGGWRARDLRLPLPTEGSDATILMPAEVEVE